MKTPRKMDEKERRGRGLDKYFPSDGGLPQAKLPKPPKAPTVHTWV
jgi:hypothetical protein